MGGANPPGRPATEPKGIMKDLEWLNAVRSINGNSSSLLRMAQDTIASGATERIPWVVAAAGAVCTHMLDAFGTMFWLIFFLWAADMLLGNIRAMADPGVSWSTSKNLDGVLRIIVYVILGLVLVLMEMFVWEYTGADIDGLLLGGGYGVCALAETRSLVKHFNWFIPGFGEFGRKLLKVMTNGKNGGG